MEAEPDAAQKPIKVVDVFNDRELAVSAGSKQGIRVDTTLAIKSGNPHVVKDPDTGEELGEIVRIKAVVRVFEVQEKFALARTFRTRTVNVGGPAAGMSALARIFEPPKFETRVETLRRGRDAGVPLHPDEYVIEIGDIAEVIDPALADDVPSLTTWR